MKGSIMWGKKERWYSGGCGSTRTTKDAKRLRRLIARGRDAQSGAGKH